LLSKYDQGPCAQVLVFDFYGRGRSEWTGNDLTLDVLVTQTRELLDALGFDGVPVSLVGYDIGGAVAVGFAAKHPSQCLSLSLLAPAGVSYSSLLPETLLRSPVKAVARTAMARWGPSRLLQQVERDFFDLEAATTHRHLLDRQRAALQWQLDHSPGTKGFLGALLSTVRHFPLEGLQELFVAVGRHPRLVLVLWGDQDAVCSPRDGMKLMERAFRKGFLVDVLDCGHNLVFEKFEDVVRELTSFHRLVFSHGPAL